MSTPKRIILVHLKGQYAGLWQILGTEDQLKDQLTTADLPTFLPIVAFGDHLGACSLVTVRPRYVLYRELIEPAIEPAISAPSVPPDQHKD